VRCSQNLAPRVSDQGSCGPAGRSATNSIVVASSLPNPRLTLHICDHVGCHRQARRVAAPSCCPRDYDRRFHWTAARGRDSLPVTRTPDSRARARRPGGALHACGAARVRVSPARRKCGVGARYRGLENAAARRLSIWCPAARLRSERTVAARRPRRRAVTPRPPDSRARASRLRRRRSCSSPAPTLMSRRPGARAVAARAGAASRTPCRAVFSPRSVSPPRGYEPNERPATPCPPVSRARARGLRRRCSCSSPPALTSRRPDAVRCRRAPRSLSQLRWRTRRTRSRGSAGERPSGHAVPARLPCTCMGASPALLVLAAATHADVSSARRQCGAGARCRGFEKCAGTEPTRRSGFAADEGSAAREAAFRIEPRAPASPDRAARLRAERAVGARRARGRAVAARPPDSCAPAKRPGRRLHACGAARAPVPPAGRQLHLRRDRGAR
jgi:hypothetical protein